MLYLVSTPIGESLEVTRLYKDYTVSVLGRNTTTDFMELEMVDFDVIMGMDMLSFCYATLDCRAKLVKFQFLNEAVLEWKGCTTTLVGKFISYLMVRRMVRKGCLA